MDSYIGAIAEAETDKGNKVMRIPTSTVTAIVEGNCLQNMTLKNVSIKKSRIKRDFSQNNNVVVALKSVKSLICKLIGNSHFEY